MELDLSNQKSLRDVCLYIFNSKLNTTVSFTCFNDIAVLKWYELCKQMKMAVILPYSYYNPPDWIQVSPSLNTNQTCHPGVWFHTKCLTEGRVRTLFTFSVDLDVVYNRWELITSLALECLDTVEEKLRAERSGGEKKRPSRKSLK